MIDYILLIIYSLGTINSIANLINEKRIILKIFWMIFAVALLIMSNVFTFMILFKELGLYTI